MEYQMDAIISIIEPILELTQARTSKYIEGRDLGSGWRYTIEEEKYWFCPPHFVTTILWQDGIRLYSQQGQYKTLERAQRRVADFIEQYGYSLLPPENTMNGSPGTEE